MRFKHRGVVDDLLFSISKHPESQGFAYGNSQRPQATGSPICIRGHQMHRITILHISNRYMIDLGPARSSHRSNFQLHSSKGTPRRQSKQDSPPKRVRPAQKIAFEQPKPEAKNPRQGTNRDLHRAPIRNTRSNLHRAPIRSTHNHRVRLDDNSRKMDGSGIQP
ncbi:hypothetical protein SUGI_0758310 [Cryptomeria japonica]|nr:hypothetical protein SUGI_0758310 [Cryptomeria japonica]